jgi:DNA-binding NarL/FixJ family response regulator
MDPVKTVIIEDEILLSNLMEIFIGQIPALRLSGIANSGADGLKLCLKHNPGLVLLDLEMPGMSGLDVAKELRNKLPSTRIIVVSSHCEPYAVHELSLLKVDGFVNKGRSLKELKEIINHVLDGKISCCETYTQVKNELRRHTEAYQKILSPREISVLMAVAENQDDATIAQRLGITPNTVCTHRRNIRQKLNAHNDRDLVKYARQWGLTPLMRE